MMKKFLAKHKKLISLVCVLSMFACGAITTSAVSNTYSTGRNYSSSHVNHDNSTYYLKTEYHVGSTNPWDDAYIYAEAGANVLKERVVSYSFGGYTNTDASASYIGDGVQNISTGRTLAGQDTGTGWCSARTHSGNTKSYSIANWQELDIR